MSLLPNADRRRAMASAALLASDVDGEVVAAAQALRRILGKVGTDIPSIIGAGLLSDDTLPAPLRRGAEPVSLLRPHQRTAWTALAFPELLTGWERAFLESLVDLRHLSARQENRLRAIAAKIERLRK